jgi:hypothetical protein
MFDQSTLATIISPPREPTASNPHDSYAVRAEYKPQRTQVSDDYITTFKGQPFNTALRPDQGFRDGTDAYHSPAQANELLLEITGENDDSNHADEYIGILGKYDPDHPTRQHLQEIKWAPPNRQNAAPVWEATRDLAIRRDGLLTDVYRGLDAYGRANPDQRGVADASLDLLRDYLAEFSLHRFDLVDELGFPDTERDKTMFNTIRSNVEAGKQYWAPEA